jgi:hypothetical protein
MATTAMAVWRSPTEKDLSASISAVEIEAYRTAAADEEAHGDPITALLERGVNFVRGYLRANSAIAMGPSGTLPESLISPCMDYIAFDVVKRVPRGNTEDRRTARQEAITLFGRVQSGTYDVESYQQPESQGNAPASQLASHAPRRVTAASLEGL